MRCGLPGISSVELIIAPAKLGTDVGRCFVDVEDVAGQLQIRQSIVCFDTTGAGGDASVAGTFAGAAVDVFILAVESEECPEFEGMLSLDPGDVVTAAVDIQLVLPRSLETEAAAVGSKVDSRNTLGCMLQGFWVEGRNGCRDLGKQARICAARGNVDAVIGVVEGRVIDEGAGEGCRQVDGERFGGLRPVAVQSGKYRIAPVACVEGRVAPCVLSVAAHDVVGVVQVKIAAGIFLTPEKTRRKRCRPVLTVGV